MLKSTIICFLLLTFAPVFAQEKLKCLPESIGFKDNQIILNEASKKGGLYLIHNISNSSIWLDHFNPENPRVSTGWSSLLKPDHWSAIISSQKDFTLNCTNTKVGKLPNLSCADYLFVCKTSIYKNRRVQDDYWYVENVNSDEFIRAIFAKIKMM